MKYYNNAERGRVTGAYLPKAAEKNIVKNNNSGVLEKLEAARAKKQLENKVEVNYSKNRDNVVNTLQKVKTLETDKLSENEKVYSNNMTFNFPKSRKINKNLAAMNWQTEIATYHSPPLDIKNVCGLNTSWVYKCTPWVYHEVCVDNETRGAWVPYPIMQRIDYLNCKEITEMKTGRQFSQDHGNAYR